MTHSRNNQTLFITLSASCKRINDFPMWHYWFILLKFVEKWQALCVSRLTTLSTANVMRRPSKFWWRTSATVTSSSVWLMSKWRGSERLQDWRVVFDCGLVLRIILCEPCLMDTRIQYGRKQFTVSVRLANGEQKICRPFKFSGRQTATQTQT